MKKIVMLKDDLEATLATKVKESKFYSDRKNNAELKWVKSVTAIDKTKNNGYCLIGEFINNNTYITNQLYVALVTNYHSGSHTGYFYILFSFNDNDEIIYKMIVYPSNSKKNWAVELIPFIEGFAENDDFFDFEKYWKYYQK